MEKTVKLANLYEACNPSGTSYGWVSPEGEFHEVPYGLVHYEWAAEYLRGKKNPEMLALDKDSGNELSSCEIIQKLGWIQMSNAYSMDAGPSARMRAWETALRKTIECVKGSHKNPFETVTHIWVDPKMFNITVDEAVHKFAPQLEHELYGTQRTAARIASCDQRMISMGWVSPEGKFFSLRGVSHGEWALKHLQEQGKAPEEPIIWRAQDQAIGLLIEEGWIRMTNVYNFDACQKATSKAWHTALGKTVECAQYGNPFKTKFFVGWGRSFLEMTVDEAVHKFAPRLEPKLYPHREAQRMAARIASRCDPKRTSMGWVDPEGKFIVLKGVTHSGWAQEYLQARNGNAGWVPEAVDVLLNEGWIRVSNEFAIEANRGATRKAWHSALSETIKCLEHQTPFEAIVTLGGTCSSKWEMTVDEVVHQFAPSLEHTLYGKKASQGCSLSSFSFGWASPDGKFHALRGRDTHNRWAVEYLSSQGVPGFEEAEDSDAEYESALYLLKEGWIQLSNAYVYSTDSSPKWKAWEAALRETLKCLKRTNSSPFNNRVEIWTRGMRKTPTVDEAVHKYAPQLEHELYQVSPSQEMAARIASNCSRNEVSMAWISPEGETIMLHETHYNWARRYLRERGDVAPLKETIQTRIETVHTLLNEGWIRMSNPFNLDAYAAKPKVWEAALKHTVACAKGHDPFSMKMFLTIEGNRFRETTVDAVVHKYAPQLEHELYGKTASCDPSDISDGWVSPDGTFHSVPLRHSQWAAEYLRGKKDPEMLALDKEHGGQFDLDECCYLLKKRGWIQMANAYFMATCPSAKKKAWETAFRRTITCIKGSYSDPFETQVLVWVDPKMFKMTVDQAVHKYAPQLEHELYANAKKASACNPSSFSMGWVNPQGEFIPLNGLHHGTWAGRYLRDDPDRDPSWKKRLDPETILLEEGWIRVANEFNFEVYKAGPKAWAAALKKTLGCVRGQDPFSTFMEIDHGRQSEELSVDEVFHRFAPQLEHELYKKASKVAGNNCDVSSSSLGWVSPTGEFHSVSSSDHTSWAVGYLKARGVTFSGSPQKFLLREGWIKASNAYVFCVDPTVLTKPKAWKTALQITIDCVRNNGKDPFNSYLEIWQSQDGMDARRKNFTVDEAVHKYAPQLEHELYKKTASYTGNPDGKPIYPVEVDHGYDKPIAGGSDMMQRLVERFRTEQGRE